MQALTMYRAIQAAALIAPTADQAAHTAARLFAARQALPPTFTRAADFWESTETTQGADFHRDTAHAEALGELLETASRDLALKYATFSHAAGRVKLANIRERLQGFAADMVKGAAWALWGGGEKPTELAKPRKARAATWRPGLVKVAAEALQDGQAADFLAIAMDQLGGRAYMPRMGAPFVVYAPDYAEGLPEGFAVARKCSGEWVTMHMGTGFSAGRSARVKAQALESGREAIAAAGPEYVASAIARAHDTEQHHAQALDAWRAAYHIQAAPVAQDAPEVAPVAHVENIVPRHWIAAAAVDLDALKTGAQQVHKPGQIDAEEAQAAATVAALVAIAQASAQAAETCAPELARCETGADVVAMAADGADRGQIQRTGDTFADYWANSASASIARDVAAGRSRLVNIGAGPGAPDAGAQTDTPQGPAAGTGGPDTPSTSGPADCTEPVETQDQPTEPLHCTTQDPKNSTMDTTDNMTGAELQTLREAAGLTREVLAGLANVQARTVKHWETRTGSAVPSDVAAIVRQAAAWVVQASREGLRAAMLQAHGGPMAAGLAKAWAGIFPPSDDAPEVVLIRYRETDHLHHQDRAQGLRADVHGAMVARLVLDLQAHGLRPRVVWFDPEDFSTWRNSAERSHVVGENSGDTHQARAAWAAQAIEAQAIPHPADQPPPGHTPGA